MFHLPTNMYESTNAANGRQNSVTDMIYYTSTSLPPVSPP